MKRRMIFLLAIFAAFLSVISALAYEDDIGLNLDYRVVDLFKDCIKENKLGYKIVEEGYLESSDSYGLLLSNDVTIIYYYNKLNFFKHISVNYNYGYFDDPNKSLSVFTDLYKCYTSISDKSFEPIKKTLLINNFVVGDGYTIYKNMNSEWSSISLAPHNYVFENFTKP